MNKNEELHGMNDNACFALCYKIYEIDNAVLKKIDNNNFDFEFCISLAKIVDKENDAIFYVPNDEDRSEKKEANIFPMKPLSAESEFQQTKRIRKEIYVDIIALKEQLEKIKVVKGMQDMIAMCIDTNDLLDTKKLRKVLENNSVDIVPRTLADLLVKMIVGSRPNSRQGSRHNSESETNSNSCSMGSQKGRAISRLETVDKAIQVSSQDIDLQINGHLK